MRVVVGAPVANRAWALPEWFACLEAQTRRPDGFCFVHSGKYGDETHRALYRGAYQVVPFGDPTVIHDPRPAHPREDQPARYHTLAALRNQLLPAAYLHQGASVFLSLDTDVMLDDPDTIERLVALIEDGWDTASPILFLSDRCRRDWKPGDAAPWAVNALRWRGDGDPYGERKPFVRVEGFEPREVVQVDVPLAAVAMNARVMKQCRYRWHEAGEDLGFAHDLTRIGARCALDTGLPAFHAWNPEHLEATREAVG